MYGMQTTRDGFAVENVPFGWPPGIVNKLGDSRKKKVTEGVRDSVCLQVVLLQDNTCSIHISKPVSVTVTLIDSCVKSSKAPISLIHQMIKVHTLHMP